MFIIFTKEVADSYLGLNPVFQAPFLSAPNIISPYSKIRLVFLLYSKHTIHCPIRLLTSEHVVHVANFLSFFKTQPKYCHLCEAFTNSHGQIGLFLLYSVLILYTCFCLAFITPHCNDVTHQSPF